jgi:hypothetical protein
VVTSPAPTTGSSPWLTATITNSDLGGVQIEFRTAVTAPEFITQIFFSLSGLNGGRSRDSTLGLVNPDTNPGLSLQSCSGAAPAGTGPYQLCLAFSSAEALRFDELAENPYIIRVTGVSLSNFAVNGNGYWSVAHVQGIPTNCSGWIGDNGATANNPGVPVEGCGSTSVPEPGTLALLGLGLLGVGIARRRHA